MQRHPIPNEYHHNEYHHHSSYSFHSLGLELNVASGHCRAQASEENKVTTRLFTYLPTLKHKPERNELRKRL